MEWEPDVAGSPELDLRRLRYFVAVAQELHFGRAAGRLFVAQPVLTRQIRRLEQELGVTLFTRTTRVVQLTPAGEQLLSDARPLLVAADAAKRRVRRAGANSSGLTVGFFVGDPIGRALRAFSESHPNVAVDLVRVYWWDQVKALLDGRVDVSLVHLPIDETGLKLVPVYAAPRVALLPRGHSLADRDRISIAEVADEPVFIQRDASPEWQAFHNVDPRPDGSHPVPGPTVRNIEEKLEHIVAGRAITFVPWTVTSALGLQPEVVAVPVEDIPPVQVCLGWSSEGESAEIRAFVEAARSALAETGAEAVAPWRSSGRASVRSGQSPPGIEQLSVWKGRRMDVEISLRVDGLEHRVLVGRRLNSCLALAVAYDGGEVVTAAGLEVAAADGLHPLQRAFVAHDAFQCGYCTPGQIVSAVGMLQEAAVGVPSVVSRDLDGEVVLDDEEIRERMSGNLCRCAAYVNIVTAIAEVAR